MHIVCGVKTLLRIAVLSVVTVALLIRADPASAASPLPLGSKPIPGPVLTRFDLPDEVWNSGHRGVDLAGGAGERVNAAASGTVTFADVLAGRGVVVVSHGSVRTTYEPVVATVAVGELVMRGQEIGRLQTGHPSCPGSTCLHWGLREGDAYLDPLLLLGPTIRLLPASATPAPQQVLGIVRPASGPVTSPYGMRRHPITGVWKLHDGADFGASCGSPIVAAEAGTVLSVAATLAWGNRLVIDHGGTPGGHLVTAYNHAEGYAVAVGATVERGQVVGSVGGTGLATGCHLHFQVWLSGRLVDPMTVLT
jgi:murein DD-endopeptidase MepM/ murein hydrolase activator NlpD